MSDVLVSAACRAAGRGTPWRTKAESLSLRYLRPSTLRAVVAAWEERARVRWKLERMWRADPHLIDDIGLTGRQVEDEAAKPFWQA